jgi:hypothetical protein
MLYGPSNAATSETETLAHDPDVRITAGLRAPMKAGQAPAPPSSLALNHAQEPDAAQRRAPNHAPGTPRRTPGLSKKHQENTGAPLR